jgi:type I restriction enzyme, S subunit
MSGRIERRDASIRQSPNGYPQARLADLTTIFSGGTPSKRRADYWVGAIPWVSPKDVKRPFLTDVADHISEEALSEGSRLVPAGSVFVVVRGMALAKDIPVAMAMRPMAFNQDIKALVPGNSVAPEFLLFSLKAHKDRLMREVGTAAHGTRRMAGSAIEDFTISLPPLGEQRATAAALRSMYEAVEVQEKIVAGLRELKAATMAKLFREGLRGERRKQTEIGKIPKSWEVARLEQIFDKMNYGTSKHCSIEPVGSAVLRIPNVIGGVVDISELKYASLPDSEMEKTLLVPGDLLFVRTNGSKENIGRCAVYAGQPPDSLFASYLIRVRLKSNSILPEFANAYLESLGRGQLVSRAHGAADGKFNIDTSDLKALVFPKPEIKEQEEIVHSAAALDSAIVVASLRLKVLRTLFSSTLHLLMTGQVRVAVGKGA